MPLFGPPNIRKLTAAKDSKRLQKALSDELLADASALVRGRAAARLLGLHIMRPELDDLVPLALEHPEWEVRWNAVQGLVKRDDPRGRDALIATAQGRHRDAEQYRREAVDALGKLKDERAIHPLVELLSDEHLRPSAARALATIGHLRCVEPLIRVLEEHPLDAWELRSIKEKAAPPS